jgi:hypothetical protein
MTTSHPKERDLMRYAFNEAGAKRMRIARHLEDCESCSAALKLHRQTATRTNAFVRLASVDCPPPQ